MPAVARVSCSNAALPGSNEWMTGRGKYLRKSATDCPTFAPTSKMTGSGTALSLRMSRNASTPTPLRTLCTSTPKKWKNALTARMIVLFMVEESAGGEVYSTRLATALGRRARYSDRE